MALKYSLSCQNHRLTAGTYCEVDTHISDTHFHLQVNGEILSECDEEVLSSDLGITSKLHRMRLMKVISGRHSARGILEGEDPYTYGTPRSS